MSTPHASDVLVCPVCAHAAPPRVALARLERTVSRLVGRRPVCGAEASDIHEATSWGEPPCACTDSFHR